MTIRGGITCLVLGLLLGCAGGVDQAERVYRIDDAELACEDIEQEVLGLLSKVGIYEAQISNNRAENLGMWITGQLFLIPFLGMDVSGNSEIQRTSIILRLQRLEELAQAKSCKLSQRNDTAPQLIKKTK